jgi:hypothetical protein
MLKVAVIYHTANHAKHGNIRKYPTLRQEIPNIHISNWVY